MRVYTLDEQPGERHPLLVAAPLGFVCPCFDGADAIQGSAEYLWGSHEAQFLSK